MGRKAFKRSISLVLVLMMILSGLQMSFAVSPPESLISLDKTAEAIPRKENTYKIKLSVKGDDVVTNQMVDVVLVIDNSNSMHDTKDGGKSLAQITKDAANAFIDGVLTGTNSGNVRVAVVQYGTYAKAYRFTNSNWTNSWSNSLSVDGNQVYTSDNAMAKNAVDKATTKFTSNGDGGTNTEGGFLMASKVAGKARGEAKSIVIFMTDGMPTYRYDGDSVESDSHWFFGNGGAETSKKELNEAIEAAQNLSKSSEIYTVALLSAFKETSNEAKLAKNLLSTAPKKYTSSSDVRNIMPQVDKSSRWTSTEPYATKYYPIFSNANAADNMKEIYETLSGVVNALAKGTVTDIIPENFQLTQESQEKLETQYKATVTIDGSGKTTIEFPNIAANKAGTNLEYEVVVKKGVYGTGFTNEQAYYTYTLFGESEPRDPEYFPKPVVAINPTAANDDHYSVNEGMTLNVELSMGVLVNDKIDTSKLEEGGYSVSDLLVNNPRTLVSAQGGTVVLNEDGSFEYTPKDGFTGKDTFIYTNKVTVSGQGGLAKDYESNDAKVTINVLPLGVNLAVYKTKHYLQDSDLTNYSLKETVTETGEIGTSVNGEEKFYTGYTYNPEAEGTVSSGTVEGDGSLVLKLYYDASLFNVIYNPNGGSGEMTDSHNPYIYDEEVSVLENEFTNEGYIFVGWGYEEERIQVMSIGDEYSAVYEPGETFSMPDTNVTLYALWAEETGPSEPIFYTVKYLDKATEIEVANDESGSGYAGEERTEYAKEVNGYTPDETEITFVIDGDGEGNVIVFYYVKDTEPGEPEEPGEPGEPEGIEYYITINHYKKSVQEGNLHSTTKATVDVTSGSSITVMGKTYKITINGYEYKSSDPETVKLPLTTTSTAITFNLVYSEKTSGGGNDNGGGKPSGGDTGGGGNPPVVIPDSEIPLAELEKTDHFAYIIGYPEGDVRPLNNITREEVAMIFYRLLTDESRDALLSDTNPFTDMEADRWSNRAVSTLFNADIISGYPDGTFRPSAPITRAEFATIAAKFDDLNLDNPTQFTDILGHWAEQYITSSENKGWIKGYPDMTFKPQQDITRAEAMTLINNVLGRKVPAENIHPDAMFWPDNPSTEWYYEAVMEATNSHDYVIEEDGDELWTGMKANKVWP